MRLTLLRPSDYARTPWKNGLGFTDQIAIHPPSADLRRGDYIWRLSSARIERESGFSHFPHHDRILVVLEGKGLTLTHTFEEDAPPDKVELAPMEPYEFPGDVPTHCGLKDGPIRDLSLFFAQGRAQARAECLKLTPEEEFSWEPSGATQLIFVLSGAVQLNGLHAAEGETIRADLLGAPSAPLLLKAGLEGARAVLVEIEHGT